MDLFCIDKGCQIIAGISLHVNIKLETTAVLDGLYGILKFVPSWARLLAIEKIQLT
jgi:hypothetical protein